MWSVFTRPASEVPHPRSVPATLNSVAVCPDSNSNKPVHWMKSEQSKSLFQQGVVGKIASYIEATRKKRSSEPAREAALKCIFDLLGAVAVGIGDIGPAAIRSASPAIFGRGDVPIWFTGEVGSVIGAAWANSSAAAALDLDDGNRFARGHPGAAIIPAAFAVGHETGATLEEIITAIVIGYEVGVAVGTARTTYGSSGTWTIYGVVAAAAALRNTPWPAVEHALAIAGESAPNQAFAGGPAPRIPAPEGAAVKEGIPWSVVSGLTSLYLAEAGHTGPRNILDSVRHYQFPDFSLSALPNISARPISSPMPAAVTFMLLSPRSSASSADITLWQRRSIVSKWRSTRQECGYPIGQPPRI